MPDHHQPSTSVSREVETRPESSSGSSSLALCCHTNDAARPYASLSVTLFFRNKDILYIPGELLKKCPKIASLHKVRPNPNPGGPEYCESVFLDVALEIGHVLIHFLITGRYQCLELKQATTSEMNASEFTTALRVYSAAQEFNLPLLGDLAEAEIRRLGGELSLPHIIDIMEGEDENPFLTPWIALYVESRVQSFLTIPTRQYARYLLSELGTPTTSSKLILRSMVTLRSRELLYEEETKGGEDLMGDQSEAVHAVPTKDDAESSSQLTHSSTIDEKRISSDTSLVLPRIDVPTPIPNATTDHQAICDIELAPISDSSEVVILSKKQKKKQKWEAKRLKKEERKQERHTADFIDVKRLSLDDEKSIRPASVLSERSRTSEIQSINSE